jgi:hypothetical protein
MVLNIVIYIVILRISSFIFFILFSLSVIILIALSLANLAFCNLTESLDKLANALRDSNYDFANTRNCEYIRKDYDLNLLIQKGVCPYEYMDSWERFYYTQFPPHGKLY